MKSLNFSRWHLCLVLVVAAGGRRGDLVCFPRRRKRERGDPPGGEVREIRLELPEGVVEPEVQPRATVIKDLAELPKASSGSSLVAAGEFEPDGARFPKGLKVTWPLPGRSRAGSELWIVTLDEKRKEWLGTGEKATVAADGQSATGIVHHFSTLGLQDGPPAGRKRGAG